MSFPYLGRDLCPFSVGPSLLLGLENPPIVCLTSGPRIVVLIFLHINSTAAAGPSQLDSAEIPIVEEHKFLGIIFDKKLTFKPHIKYLRSKCNKTIQQ